MKQKYREGHNEEKVAVSLTITLPQYVNQYAPEIVAYQSFMENETALTFWTRLFEKSKDEGKREIKDRIVWPYADRIIYLAKKFLKQEKKMQAYIMKAAKVNIFWRGDDVGMFQLIVNETLDYRELDQEQKRNYQKRALQVCQGMRQRHGL